MMPEASDCGMTELNELVKSPNIQSIWRKSEGGAGHGGKLVISCLKLIIESGSSWSQSLSSGYKEVQTVSAKYRTASHHVSKAKVCHWQFYG